MYKKLLNKNYLLIVMSAGLFYISSFMMNSVRGRYCVDTGQSKFVCGLVIRVFTLSSFISRPLWAYFTDKTGRRIVVGAGLLLCFTASVMPVFSGSVWILMFSRFVFGGGYSAVTTAAGTIVCDVSRPDLLPKAISFYGVTNVFSQAVAPTFALWIYKKSFVWVCVTVAALIAVGRIMLLFIKYKENSFLDRKNTFSFFEKTALPAGAVIFFFAAAVASVYSYVPVMALERNINRPSVFFILSAIALLTGRLMNTKLSQIFTIPKVFYFGCIGLAVGFSLLAFSGDIFLLCISALFYGFGGGITHPIANTAAVKNCKRSDRGLATATFMMSQDIGMTIGAVIRGIVSGTLGFVAVYMLSAVLCLGMIISFRYLLADSFKDK